MLGHFQDDLRRLEARLAQQGEGGLRAQLRIVDGVGLHVQEQELLLGQPSRPANRALAAEALEFPDRVVVVGGLEQLVGAGEGVGRHAGQGLESDHPPLQQINDRLVDGLDCLRLQDHPQLERGVALFPFALLQRVGEGLLQSGVDQTLEAHRGIVNQHGAADVQTERFLHLGRQAIPDEALQPGGDAPPHLVEVGVGDLLFAARW